MAAAADDEAAAASTVFEADCVAWVDVIIEVAENVRDVKVVEENCDDVDDDEEVKEDVVDASWAVASALRADLTSV